MLLFSFINEQIMYVYTKGNQMMVICTFNVNLFCGFDVIIKWLYGDVIKCMG